MNELLAAAKAVIDLYDYTGPLDECEAINRLIDAVERAESRQPMRLSDDEICKIAKTSRAIEDNAMLPVAFARAVERAIWKKNQ